MHHRHKVIRILSQFEKKSWSQLKRELLEQDFQIGLFLVDKIGELMKIKGPTKKIEDRLKELKGLRFPNRFKKVIEYFNGIRRYLENFGVLQIDP